MTKDLAVAKRIFAEISPDAVTLSAETLANPMRGCDTGAFCDLPGGLYLNAIYNADFALIQEYVSVSENAAFVSRCGAQGHSETAVLPRAV